MDHKGAGKYQVTCVDSINGETPWWP